jgi:hypothetical protein
MWLRDFRAKECGARDLRAKECGARDLRAKECGAGTSVPANR